MAKKDDLKKFLANKKQQATAPVDPTSVPVSAVPETVKMFNTQTIPQQDLMFKEPVPSNTDNVGMIPLKFDFVNVDVEPIIIDDINDTTGRLSSRIEALEQKYGVGVLPYKATKIMPNVKRLQRHIILDLFGQKYISGIKQPVNKGLLDETLKNIQLSLESGTSYISTINTVVVIDGISYPTLKFNTYELSYINKRFQHYNPQIKQTATGEILLTVGNYE